SESLRANASARSWSERHPITGIAPSRARVSATTAPSPPEPPARMTDFPVMFELLDINAVDESGINRFPDQGFKLLANIFPPAFRKRLDSGGNFHFGDLEAPRQIGLDLRRFEGLRLELTAHSKLHSRRIEGLPERLRRFRKRCHKNLHHSP